MLVLRRGGLAVLSFAAVLVFFLMEPDQPDEGSLNLSPTNYQSLITAALADNAANDARADSAPQQQVVNGWVARDLLQIQALQLADMLDAVTQESESGAIVAEDDPRVAALLVIAILAISLIGVTSYSGPPLLDVVPAENPRHIDVDDGDRS